MKKTKKIIPICLLLSSFALSGCGDNGKSDEYEGDKLRISIRNLYFDDYSGGDRYLEEVEDKFGVRFDLAAYDWANWNTQVNGQINSDNLTDVFHANIDSYNFAQQYKFWAEEEMIKPLPDNMSKWPNLKKLIDNTSNIDALRIDGRLYGLPIAKNTTDYATSFSPFTYIYRRDWAKQWGVYQENDEYTWNQFKALLEKFRDELSPTNRYAFADVEWGYPSITNFYKQVPHCFAQDTDTGKYVNNYTTEAYLTGLDESRAFMNSRYYHPDQNSAADGAMNTRYYSNQVGVLYENLSYSNFVNLKNQLKKNNASVENFNVEDATAIMRIKGEDGKYALEGTDNWFSMTFFDHKISDAKQTKILDILDWLLSEEGTTFAIYGFEGYDYTKVGDEIKIQEEYWPKDLDGTYARKDNGAKYLRYLVSLGYDTLKIDPLSDLSAVTYLEDWEQDMREAYRDGHLKILKENAEVMWLTTPKKSLNAGNMRTQALNNVMKYTYGKEIHDRDAFKATFPKIWDEVLSEINTALGK